MEKEEQEQEEEEEEHRKEKKEEMASRARNGKELTRTNVRGTALLHR